MILKEKAQATILIVQNDDNYGKMGSKIDVFLPRFSNFANCTRVFAVHIATKYSSDLQEHGKNSQKMRFDAITGLKTGFRSEAKVNSGSILYSQDRHSLPF